MRSKTRRILVAALSVSALALIVITSVMVLSSTDRVSTSEEEFFDAADVCTIANTCRFAVSPGLPVVVIEIPDVRDSTVKWHQVLVDMESWSQVVSKGRRLECTSEQPCKLTTIRTRFSGIFMKRYIEIAGHGGEIIIFRQHYNGLLATP
ncbi:MAG: hypothetical protein WCT24_01340 [Patescibacteria group bacterium]|jgi:hypothetical protein